MGFATFKKLRKRNLALLKSGKGEEIKHMKEEDELPEKKPRKTKGRRK